MRKLSKKISMLMVLAMLVSLFSGVVSASAASSWSFYNKTADEIVEVKESIEMESNQFADFDLYKDGKAFDTDVYTVKYESSNEDVVWVDAKNGKLRADKFGNAEAGDKAVVSAKIENKNTGAKTTKSFTIVIAEEEVEVEYAIVADIADEVYAVGEKHALAAKVTADGEAVEAKVAFTVDGVAITEFVPAKAGEYTIVATATIDGEVVATEKYTVDVINLDEFELEQKSMNTFTMTFAAGKDLSKFAKDDITVFQAAAVDGVQIKQFVKDVTVKGNVVTVTLYNEMSKDSFVFVNYAEESNALQVVKGDVASVVVTPGKVEINKLTDISIKLYDQFGVDITTDALLAKVTVEKVAGGENANLSGKKILFWAEGKMTSVKATYHTYTYKDGKEVTYTSDVAELTSVKSAESLSNVTEWVVTTETNKDSIKWNGKTNVALGDTGYYAIGKIVKTTAAVSSKDETIITHGQGLTFESSNNAVVMVGSNGLLLPISVGSADIIAKGANNVIKGVFTVNVVPQRKASNIELKFSNNLISYNDSIAVTLNVTDQYGDSFKATAGNIEVKDITTNAAATLYTPADNKVTFSGAINGSAAADTKTYYRSIKVGDAIAYFEFTVKKVEGDAVSYAFAEDTVTLDTTIAKNSDKTFTELYGDKVIAVKGYDKNNMLTTAGATITGIKSAEDVSKYVTDVTENAFYITINAPSTPGDTAKAWAAANISVGASGVTFKYVKVDGSNLVTKAPAGTYVISLYKAVKSYKDGETQYYSYTLCDSVPVTVKDAQKGYNVEVKAIKTEQKVEDILAVSGAAFATAVKDVFKISYDGNEITAAQYAGITAGVGNDYTIGTGTNVVFKKANITTSFDIKGTIYKLDEVIYFPGTPVTGK